jgi:hypothetical protein
MLVLTSCGDDVGHSDVFGLFRVEVGGLGLAIYKFAHLNLLFIIKGLE